MVTGLDTLLDRLALYGNETEPVLSLYLDLRADQHGRDAFRSFLDGAFAEQRAALEYGSPAYEALRRDVERIEAYLETSLEPSSQSAAIFCSNGGADLFEAIQLDAPLDGHRLYVDKEPHLFPLARLVDQFSTYAAVLVNTNSARIFVFSLGAVQRRLGVQNEKTRRTSPGGVAAGLAENKYQRHVDEMRKSHMKEVAEVLERLVREEGIERVVIAGDEVAIPMLRDELPATVASRIVDHLRLDIRTPEADVLAVTLDSFRKNDAESDRELVEQALDGARSRGLGVTGLSRVKKAFGVGQIDRLLVPAAPRRDAAAATSDAVTASVTKDEVGRLDEADLEELVTMARKTDASITFIEDARLLDPAGGVAALLRFRM